MINIGQKFQLKLTEDFLALQAMLVEGLADRYNKLFDNPPQTSEQLASHLIGLFEQIRKWDEKTQSIIDLDTRTKEEREFDSVISSFKTYIVKAEKMALARQVWSSTLAKFESTRTKPNYKLFWSKRFTETTRMNLRPMPTRTFRSPGKGRTRNIMT